MFGLALIILVVLLLSEQWLAAIAFLILCSLRS